jgi:hypothetical protein
MSTISTLTGWEHGCVTPGLLGLGWINPQRLSIAVSGNSIETSIVHHGTKALRLGTGGGQWAFSCNAVGHWVTSFMFYLVALPAGGTNTYISHFTPTGGTGTAIVWVDSSGVIHAQVGSGTVQDGPTLSAGAWNRLDGYMRRNVNPPTFDWAVNGTAQTQAVGQALAATTNATHYLGVTGSSNSNTEVIYDCYVSSSINTDFPLGEHYVLGYAPNEDTDISQVGSGAFQDISGTAISGGNPAWDNLDSRDFEQTAELLKQTGTDAAGFVEIGFENSVESTAPVAVRIEGNFNAAGTTACDIEARIRSGTNEASWANGDPSETAGYKGGSTYDKEPVSGSVWTDTLFDALRCRIGYSSDANPDPWIYAILLEAAFVAQAVPRVPRFSPYPQALAH